MKPLLHYFITPLLPRPFVAAAVSAAILGSALAQTPTPTAAPTVSPTATPVQTNIQLEYDPVNPATLVQVAPATTGTMSVNLTGSMFTITPTGACTFNSTGTNTRVGKLVTFVVTTSGTTSFVMTWGTNFKAAGTLATGTVAAKKFTVTFRCLDGTTWIEISRTPAM